MTCSHQTFLLDHVAFHDKVYLFNCKSSDLFYILLMRKKKKLTSNILKGKKSHDFFHCNEFWAWCMGQWCYFIFINFIFIYLYHLFKLHDIKNLENISQITLGEKDNFFYRKQKCHFLCPFFLKNKAKIKPQTNSQNN